MSLDIVKGEPFTTLSGTLVLPYPDSDGRTYITSIEIQEMEEEKARKEELEKETSQIVSELNNELEDPFLQNPQNQKFVVNDFKARSLSDIQTDYKNMNVVMIVLSYTIWGLPPAAIARILNIDVNQVQDVQSSELFEETRKELIESLRYAEQSTINGYLANKAFLAAQTIASEMSQTKDRDRAMKAAQDILDRSGFRPVDRVEHSHKFGDELRIVHVEDKKTKEIELKDVF